MNLYYLLKKENRLWKNFSQYFCIFVLLDYNVFSLASNFKPSITAIPLMNVKHGNEEKVLHTLKNKRTRPVA
jgi:hypothetical protein